MYGLQALDSWLYDDDKPFIHLAAGDTFKALREKIDTDYYEKLIERYLLNNEHRSVVIVVPEIGLVEKEDKELADKLADYKASLSAKEIENIVNETAALKAYQDEEDTPEQLECIPVLELKDIKKETAPLYNDMRQIKGVRSLYHPIDTHGIDYLRLIFDITDLPNELFGYAGMLKNSMGLVDTANYTYGELFNQINIRTGGIVPVCNIYTDSKNLDDTRVTFEWKAKVLEGGLDAAFELLEEIIFTSVLDNEKRNRELISEVKSRTQATMMSAGHQVAVGRIGTYFSKGAVITDKISGYTNYKLTEKLDNEYESIKESYIEKLNELVKYIFRKENLMFDFAGSENEYKLFEKKAEAFLDRLNEHESKDIAVMPAFDPKPVIRNEGIMRVIWMISRQTKVVKL